jgi:hypothetical protein
LASSDGLMMDIILDRLRQLHHPTAPAVLTDGQWRAVEGQLGIAMPDDYKALLGLYAEGPPFAEWYGFYNFLTEEGRAAAQKDLTHLRWVREQVHGEMFHVAELLGRPENSVYPPVPFPVYPEPGGLYPWGWAQDGWTFYWLCHAAPQAWDVVAGFKWVEEFCLLPNKTATQLLLEIDELPPTANLESILNKGVRVETAAQANRPHD